ncbi:hypothetical protein GGR52DRAFT_574161 [Hypoxylon sp. FL1284]|nr:hypothetical protein GGR52DRAFT_574161 [Hypoxylon sp. FL1284]
MNNYKPWTQQELDAEVHRREGAAIRMSADFNQARQFTAVGLPTNRQDTMRNAQRFIGDYDDVDTRSDALSRTIRNNATAAHTFIDHVRDSSGRIDRDRLLAATSAVEQVAFDRSLLFVTARQGNLDFIRNISQDHRPALGILDRKDVEYGLSGEIAKLKDELEAKDDEMKQKVSDLEAELQVDANRAEKEVDALRARLQEKEKEATTASESIRALEDAKSKLEREAAENQQRVLELNRTIEDKEQASGVRAKDAEISSLGSQIRTKDAEMRGLPSEARAKATEISSLEAQLRTAQTQHRLARREAEELTRSLGEARDGKEASEQTAAARELGVARFLAARARSEGAQPDRWVPFVREVARANVFAGPITDSLPYPRPWTFLLTWRPEQDQQDYVPRARPSRVGVVDLAGSLYARALAEGCGEESLCLLGLLIGRLYEDESAPFEPALLALRRYAEYSERLDIPRAEAPVQLFFFGLGSAAALVAGGWQSAESAEIRDRLWQRLEDSPMQQLNTLLWDRTNLRRKLRSWDSSAECVFSEEQGIGLVRLPRLPDWIFVICLPENTVRLIHNTRGKWTDLGTFRIIPPTSGQELSIHPQTTAEYAWLVGNFRSRGGA